MAHLDFLNGSHLFVFIHDIYHPHIPLSILSFLKEVTCCTKNVVSTEKVIHIEVTFSPKLCESQKIVCGNQENYVTSERETHVD